MKQLSVFALFAVVILTTSCQEETKKVEEVKDELSATNPFFEPSKLLFQAPDFDKIRNTDFLPAMDAGMRAQLSEMKEILDNPGAPTFENTFIPLEESGQLLSRVRNVFNLLSGANTNPELQAIEEVLAPKFAEHKDAIYLNSKLFKRVKSIYDNRESLRLDSESKHLVENYYQRFVLSGANLEEADQLKLRELNGEVATLSAKFTNQLMAAAKEGALVVENKDALAGLSEAEIDAAANEDKTEWTLPLQNTTQQPSLQSLTNRETRETLFKNSWNRAEQVDENDTRAIIERIAQIRAEQASILGFENFAAWKLQDQMAKTPKAVQDFLDQLVPATTAKAKVEAADIQSLIDKQNGGFDLEAWDWNFYAEQVRKERYDLDDSQIKPYFELWNVLENGVFYAANQLYGLTFKERKDLPVYQEDVRVYDVIDKDGSQIGLFYGDFFKRDNKSGGAWMSNIIDQSKLLGTKPVIYNVCNFTKPAAEQPALVSFDDVITMFHEFGHALHGFFADQEYVSLSGTNTPRDFVEFPSQFNENWALYPSILNNYAKHYKTGEPMPQALIDKIKKASTFNQGYALTEVVSAASLDMQWHTITTDNKIEDADAFEQEALKRTHLDLSAVPPRYRSSYFLHIWGNGYAAGYYAYLWTEMLDHDAYEWFENNGGLTPENGQRFRDMILSRGNTEDFEKLYHEFRGQDPDIKPMLKNRGLTE
ncbi:peptidyl-dipeptidase Dcp [Formosa algae]|uniref:Dipeptidyl carboxypeptidase n=1 Tax=Formosa algae TaxID=225843 RepID=A0A9X0YKK9_9FLAO|nr:peptidyl-dipeptidase Dcp [Formosa algae]MBP1840324.1 peptidyl-dipeptidase Dcp [Formosa algae]MDQ0334188.1 peptidyl-dipeptidase Dcp [Formosa algae]OEI79509.1 dipeptidyl carboxypeptidase II [Formosa algae]